MRKLGANWQNFPESREDKAMDQVRLEIGGFLKLKPPEEKKGTKKSIKMEVYQVKRSFLFFPISQESALK